jgi:hypothetical protein
MKKNIVLASLALSMVVAPIFADVTINGDLEFGISNDFASVEDQDADEGKDGFVYEVDDLDLDIKATVGDSATVKFDIEFDEVEFNTYEIDDIDTVPYIGEVHLFVDLITAAGIKYSPFDLTLITGYQDEIGAKGYEGETKVKWDDFCDRDPDINWAAGLKVEFDDITVWGSSHLDFISDDDGLNASGVVPGAFIGVFGSIGLINEFDLFFNLDDELELGDNEYKVHCSSVGASVVTPFYLNNSMSLVVSAMFVADIDRGIAESDYVLENTALTIGGSVAFKVDNLTLGVSTEFQNARQFETLDSDDSSDDDDLGLGFDLNCEINDIFAVYVAISMDDVVANSSDYEQWFSDHVAEDNGYEATAGYEVGITVENGKADYAFGYRSGSIDVEANDIDALGEGAFFTAKLAF